VRVPAVKSPPRVFERLVQRRRPAWVKSFLITSRGGVKRHRHGASTSPPPACRLAPTVLGLDRANLVTFENPGPSSSSDLEQWDWAAGRHEPRPGLERSHGRQPDRQHPNTVRNTAGPPPPAAWRPTCARSKPNTSATRYCNEMAFIPGDCNDMADDASRLCHLSDTSLHMNTTFRRSALAPELDSALTPDCALRSKPPEGHRSPDKGPGLCPLDGVAKASSTPSGALARFHHPKVKSTLGRYRRTPPAPTKNAPQVRQSAFLVSSVPL
jgi:hypothetical protein